MTKQLKVVARALALGSLVVTAACTPASDDGNKPAAGGSSGTSTGGSRGGGSGSGGSVGSGSGGSSQPGTGGSAPTGSGGSGASAGGAGGSAPVGSGGSSGRGGASGGSDAAGESAPGPGGVAAAGKMAKSLFKVVIARYDPDGRSGCSPADPGLRSQRNEDVLMGDANTVYDVTFRVRGLVEPKVYNGGMPDPANPFVLVGGTPSTTGRENASNQYTRYSIDIAEPKQVYWLNRFHGMHTDHEVYEMDYKLTVKVKGGSMMALVLADANNCAIANHRRKTVPSVPADVVMQPFKDQFLLVEVESIKPGT